MSNASRLTVALAAVLASCGINNRTNFRDAFPDAVVLVTTTDPVAVRAQLAKVALPDRADHNDELLALLRSNESIDAAHLVLLVRAVALPENIQVTNGRGHWSYPQRGKSGNAAFVDQLLTEGADRIGAIDGYWLGEMIGISQSDLTMLMLCNRFVPQVDDGSDRAFDEIVRGMPGSPALMPFLEKFMGPQGRLDGERGWHAFASMSFDDDRASLLATVLRHEPDLTNERFLKAMRAFSFDDGRKRAFDLLVERVKPLDADTAHAAIATFSFDSGRGSAFATLAKPGSVDIDEADLLKFLKLFSFDSGRIKLIKQFADSVQGDVTYGNANKLLRAFSFDSDRLTAIKIMAPRWLALSVNERRKLAKAFSFDSSREKALGYLMR